MKNRPSTNSTIACCRDMFGSLMTKSLDVLPRPMMNRSLLTTARAVPHVITSMGSVVTAASGDMRATLTAPRGACEPRGAPPSRGGGSEPAAGGREEGALAAGGGGVIAVRVTVGG